MIMNLSFCEQCTAVYYSGIIFYPNFLLHLKKQIWSFLILVSLEILW